MNRVIALTLAIIFSGCATKKTEGFDEFIRANDFDSIILEAFSPKELKLISGIESLGEITSKITAKWKTHSGQVWDTTIYKFPGLEIVVHAPENEPSKIFVSKITITSSKWSLLKKVSVGKELVFVENSYKEWIGEYTKGSGDFCGMVNCIYAKTKNGIIVELIIKLYFDVWPA